MFALIYFDMEAYFYMFEQQQQQQKSKMLYTKYTWTIVR